MLALENFTALAVPGNDGFKRLVQQKAKRITAQIPQPISSEIKKPKEASK